MPSLNKLAPIASNEAIIYLILSFPYHKNYIPTNIHIFKQFFSILCSYYSIMSHLCCISSCCSVYPFPTLLNYFHVSDVFSSSPCHERYDKMKNNIRKYRIQYHYLLFLFSALFYPTKASWL